MRTEDPRQDRDRRRRRGGREVTHGLGGEFRHGVPRRRVSGVTERWTGPQYRFNHDGCSGVEWVRNEGVPGLGEDRGPSNGRVDVTGGPPKRDVGSGDGGTRTYRRKESDPRGCVNIELGAGVV